MIGDESIDRVDTRWQRRFAMKLAHTRNVSVRC